MVGHSHVSGPPTEKPSKKWFVYPYSPLGPPFPPCALLFHCLFIQVRHAIFGKSLQGIDYQFIFLLLGFNDRYADKLKVCHLLFFFMILCSVVPLFPVTDPLFFFLFIQVTNALKEWQAMDVNILLVEPDDGYNRAPRVRFFLPFCAFMYCLFSLCSSRF